eukprot:Platyproteum_vivax@DN16688_c0_g1_i1.p1
MQKNHRETQTYKEKTRSSQTSRETAQQMVRKGYYISPNPNEVWLTAKPYVTAQEIQEIQIEKCIIIQKFARGLIARRRYHKMQMEFLTKYLHYMKKKHQSQSTSVSPVSQPHSAIPSPVSPSLQLSSEAAKLLSRLQELSEPTVWINDELRQTTTTVYTPTTLLCQDLLLIVNGLYPLRYKDQGRLVLEDVGSIARIFADPFCAELLELIEREKDLVIRCRPQAARKGLYRRMHKLLLRIATNSDKLSCLLKYKEKGLLNLNIHAPIVTSIAD